MPRKFDRASVMLSAVFTGFVNVKCIVYTKKKKKKRFVFFFNLKVEQSLRARKVMCYQIRTNFFIACTDAAVLPSLAASRETQLLD